MKEELPERYFYSKNTAIKIDKILKEILPKKGQLDKNHRRIESAWRDIIGEDIYRNTEIAQLKGRTLYINVESSVMAHHLTNFEKLAIINKINETIGERCVEDIRFKVGRIKDDRRE